MTELALGVVEPEEQGSDFPAAVFIAEAADNAVSRPKALHLNHRPFARLVGARQFLCNHAIRCAVATSSRSHVSAMAKSVVAGEMMNLFRDLLVSHEGFQQMTTLLEGPVNGDRAIRRRQNVKDDKSCRNVRGKPLDADSRRDANRIGRHGE